MLKKTKILIRINKWSSLEGIFTSPAYYQDKNRLQGSKLVTREIKTVVWNLSTISVSWCRLAPRQLTKDELRNKIYDNDFACNYPWFYTDGFWSKWDEYREVAAFAIKKNRFEVPYDVWDSAICDFDKTYRAYLTKVEKNKQKGKEADPSNKFTFTVRSKKDPQRSFEVRYHDFNAKNSAYNFVFKMDKFESLS